MGLDEEYFTKDEEEFIAEIGNKEFALYLIDQSTPKFQEKDTSRKSKIGGYSPHPIVVDEILPEDACWCIRNKHQEVGFGKGIHPDDLVEITRMCKDRNHKIS